MRETSAAWDALHDSDAGILETKAVINGAEYFDISAPAINRAAMQDAMTVGNVISASCVFTVRTEDSIPKAARVEIFSRYTDGEQQSEWVAMGTFFIAKRQRDPINRLVPLECYDSLLKANAPIISELPWTDENNVVITDENGTPIMFDAVYPRDMRSVAVDIAHVLGVQIDSRTTIGTGDVYVVLQPNPGATMRDVLSQIAAVNAGNWIITPENKLRLVPVVSADDADEAAEYVEVTAVVGGLQVGDERTVSGVQYTYGDSDIPVLIGSDTGYIMNVTLPYAQANALAQVVIGMKYRPYVMTNCRYNPAAEIGDFVRYSDDVASVIYGEAASYGVVLTSDLQAPDFAEGLDEYPYIGASQNALNQAKAYTVEKVERAVSAIDESLTQEDIFNRLTGGGSEQGVLLYNGKIYINASYISAGTVSADILKGGTLTLGGENNRNGVLIMLDVNGNEVGRWSANGIEAKKGNILLDNNSVLQIGFNRDNTQYARFDSYGMAIVLDGNTFLGTSSIITASDSPIPNKQIGRLEMYVISDDDSKRLDIDMRPGHIQAGLYELNENDAWIAKKYLYYDTDSFQIVGEESRFSVYFKSQHASMNSLQYTGDYVRLGADVDVQGNLSVSGSINAGASGTFTTADGKTVTVSGGIVTSIV